MEITIQFDRLEQKKTVFLRTLSPWTLEQLRFRPTLSDWSALQVVDHVVRTEREIFVAMQIGLTRSRPSPFADRIRGSLLNALVRSPVRVKVPAAATLVLPGDAPDLAETRESWNELRSLQKKWLAVLGNNYSGKGIFRHPVSGWMTPSQTFGFLSAHLHHHGYQLSRLRRNPAWACFRSFAG